MVNSNIDALGIIFPNSYDDLVPELVADRLMASIPVRRPLSYDRLYPVQYGKLRDR